MIRKLFITVIDKVQKERDAVLRSHGIENVSAVPTPSTQRDLLATSSSHFAGEADAACALEGSVGELNYTGHTVNDLVTLMQIATSKNDNRRDHMARDVVTLNQLTPTGLKKRYKEEKLFTADTIFGRGDRNLGPAVRDEVIHRNEARWNKEAAVSNNKKKNAAKWQRRWEISGTDRQQRVSQCWTHILRCSSSGRSKSVTTRYPPRGRSIF